MRTTMLRAAALTILLGLGASSATAQGYRPAYYYPTPGYYNTTAGVMYIATPGYYYNVPSGYAPSYSYAPAPSYGTGGTYHTYRPTYSGHSDNPNSPPYYSGATHTLHARGWDAGQHGR